MCHKAGAKLQFTLKEITRETRKNSTLKKYQIFSIHNVI